MSTTVIDLKALAEAGRYRISHDESAEMTGQTHEERKWLVQIEGRNGHVFVQGVAELGAYVKLTVRARLDALLAIPGARLLQRGDSEASVAFPPEHLDHVASILKLRRRRPAISEEHARKLAEAGAKHRFVPVVSVEKAGAMPSPTSG